VWVWEVCCGCGHGSFTCRVLASNRRRQHAVQPCSRFCLGARLGDFARRFARLRLDLLITWLPSYLGRDERGYSLKQMAVFGFLPYWGMAATSLAGGWASDYWIASAGQQPLCENLCGCGVVPVRRLILPAAMVANKSLAMGLLVGSCVSLGLFTSNVWAITQTLAGAAAAGKWTAFKISSATWAEYFPNRSRLIVQKPGHSFFAFAAAPEFSCWERWRIWLLVLRVEVLGWEGKQRDRVRAK